MKWAIIGILLVLLGSAAAASTVLVSPNPVALAIEAGNHYAKKGEFTTALGWFGKAIELNSLSAAAYHNQGVVYHELGQADGAIASFESAIAANPLYAKAQYSLALEYYAQKQYGSSIEALKKFVALEPGNANAHFDLGVIYIEQFQNKEIAGNLNEADFEDLKNGLAHYRTALSIDSDFPHAAQNADIVENVLKEYFQ